MNVTEFVEKWRKVELTERSAAQQHFLDLCEVFEQAKPASVDPTGESFTFEKGASKEAGGDGWADVWKRGFFGWEYKGKHKDLDAAYRQLLQYREALENPPLLVVCDMDRIEVRTNFTGTRTELHRIPLAQLASPRSLEVLRAVFHAPERLKPGTTSEAITAEAARSVGELAVALRERGLDPRRVARFLDRIVFALFAEDVGLLPEGLVSRLLEKTRTEPERFGRLVGQLFTAMAAGGDFGIETIRRFDGNLFDSGEILELTRQEIERLWHASRLDWGAVDASILGTLFERGMDPAKRSQLGAHYTSREDIETLVEPVVMAPLRREWDKARRWADNLLATGRKEPKGREKPPTGRALARAEEEALRLVRRFLEDLAHVKVLDPACGSGNFLYVTLQKLKDLEKAAILYAQTHLGAPFIPLVGPWQLHGIEISPYAHELAQMTVWIGYLQWVRNNGFGVTEDPVLRPMGNFQCKDAVLDLSNPEDPREPEWPTADFIVGNPPFLGDKLMRGALGDEYVERLRGVYADRIPGQADLCCYWFERARADLALGRVRRVGLLGTQGIRGGANREVLRRIKETGDIFFAVSDRDWILEGANVHISMVGFDNGADTERILDGRMVPTINSNLTSTADLTQARRLVDHAELGFIGVSMHGPFDLDEATALGLILAEGNPRSRANSDVVLPILNAKEITERARNRWIVYFRPSQSEAEAALYELPFEHVRRTVGPSRKDNRRRPTETGGGFPEKLGQQCSRRYSAWIAISPPHASESTESL